MNESDARANELIQKKRELEQNELLVELESYLELPMVVLSFIMLFLFLVEITTDLPPDTRRIIALIQWFIWVAFIIEFIVELAVARDKWEFIKHNWLMTLAVLLPVLRVFRVLKAARAARSLMAVRVVTVSNRTISQLGILFERRKLQYLMAVAVAVTVLSGAGIYFLERRVPGANITTFGDAMWWAAGTVSTVGTELFPLTAEGRVIAVMVMVFGVSIFSYLAASLASLFVNMDKSDQDEQAATSKEVEQGNVDNLQRQVQALEEKIAALHQPTARTRSEGERPLS